MAFWRNIIECAWETRLLMGIAGLSTCATHNSARHRFAETWRNVANEARYALGLHLLASVLSVPMVMKVLRLHPKQGVLPWSFWNLLLEASMTLRLGVKAEFQLAIWNLILAAGGISDQKSPCHLFKNVWAITTVRELWEQILYQNIQQPLQMYDRSDRWSLGIIHRALSPNIVHIAVVIGLGAVYYLIQYVTSSFTPEICGYVAAAFEFVMLQVGALAIERVFLDARGEDVILYEVGLHYETILGRIWTIGCLLLSCHGMLGSELGREIAEMAATGPFNTRHNHKAPV